MSTIYQIIEKLFLNKKKSIYLVFSVIASFILAQPEDITWARDRINYMNYAEFSQLILERNFSNGILTLLTNEPLFLLINMFMSLLFSPENVVRLIIFLSSLGVLCALGKISKYNIWVLFFFFFLPQIVKNHIIHLRQGLGLCIYLLGLASNKKILKYSSMFIHSSFIFLLLFEVLEKLFKRMKFSLSLRLLFSSVLLTCFVLIVPKLALIFGDRRATLYNFTIGHNASGLGFLIWLFVGILYIIVIKKDNVSIISSYGLIFYLISYFLLDFGARIFENIIPLILVVALSDHRKDVRSLFAIFFLLYGLIQWYSSGLSFLI